MKIISILIVIIFLNSCNTSETDCENVIIDEKLEALATYNKTFYDENYTGEVISHFENNKSQVEWKLYYKNGEIVKYESFYENGDPKIVKPVKCNSAHGNVIVYRDKEKKGYELVYKLGHKHGVGKSYFGNGKVQRVVHFINDKRHGEQYEFSIEGDTILIEKYEHGKKLK